MPVERKDVTANPDLASTTGRVGPVRSRRPIYRDLLPPCNAGCPAGENIQEWLRLIKVGRHEDAWHQLTADNPFPAVHGRVCYHPCETACNRGDLDSAVSIRSVERYLGDLAIANQWQYRQPAADTGRRIMIVGAGPSGLAAAYHLRRLGHSVDIYDSADKPGGMMRYGIPEYRLPRDVLDAEIARVEQMGVTIHSNHTVDDLEALKAQGNYEAVFVAIGAHLSKRVDIPSADASKMIDAVSFLRDVSSGQRPVIGRRVAVYGAGNTAMDAARVARRLGAEESVVVYRRTQAQMPAHAEEYDSAVAEGVQMNWLRTISTMDTEGIKVEIMELDDEGRPHGTGKFETLAADTVILAVGQDCDTGFLRGIEGMKFDNDVVQVDPTTLMTDVPGIFAGGDAVPSERTVTVGTGHGKRAAREIHRWLQGDSSPRQNKKPIVGLDEMNLWYFGDHHRSENVESDVEVRLAGFAEIVAGLSPEQAEFEARRCLSCGNCFECDGCFGACPEDAIIKLGPGNRYEFDYAKCTGCATCYEQCPVDAIGMIREDQL